MIYKVLSRSRNQYEIEVKIEDKYHQTLVICEEEQIQECVECFIKSIINPATQIDDTQTTSIVDKQQKTIEELIERISYLESKINQQPI